MYNYVGCESILFSLSLGRSNHVYKFDVNLSLCFLCVYVAVYVSGITDLMDMSLSKVRELVMDKGSLACCSPWGHKGSDMTELLN